MELIANTHVPFKRTTVCRKKNGELKPKKVIPAKRVWNEGLTVDQRTEARRLYNWMFTESMTTPLAVVNHVVKVLIKAGHSPEEEKISDFRKFLYIAVTSASADYVAENLSFETQSLLTEACAEYQEKYGEERTPVPRFRPSKLPKTSFKDSTRFAAQHLVYQLCV